MQRSTRTHSAPGDGLRSVALQGDQLLKSNAGGGPVLPHLRNQGADDQDVFALRKALQRLMRQQIGIGLTGFWSTISAMDCLILDHST